MSVHVTWKSDPGCLLPVSQQTAYNLDKNGIIRLIWFRNVHNRLIETLYNSYRCLLVLVATKTQIRKRSGLNRFWKNVETLKMRFVGVNIVIASFHTKLWLCENSYRLKRYSNFQLIRFYTIQITFLRVIRSMFSKVDCLWVLTITIYKL